MKCLLCGSESESVLCLNCQPNASEDLCYKIIKYDYYNSDNDLWKEISDSLEKTYMFKDYAMDVADYIEGKRSDFVKICCMNKKSSYIGVPKDYREFVLSHVDQLLQNDSLLTEEKNLILSLTFEIYIAQKNWDKADIYKEKIRFDNRFIDPYLIVADYNIKIRQYDYAQALLRSCIDTFNGKENIQSVYQLLEDCTSRKEGIKKPWKPGKAEEITEFYNYLDKLGVEHKKSSYSKKKKILLKDFKPFNYYSGSIPSKYVAVWFTSEFYVKQREVVEINAIRVRDGKCIDEFHMFVKPVNSLKRIKYVSQEDLESAEPIINVFPRFVDYLGSDIVSIAGVEEQTKYLSRLARYSMMDHFDNEIFDVIAYGEDLSEDFDLYTRETLLEKYGLKEGESGMEKTKVTYYLIEKMRGL